MKRLFLMAQLCLMPLAAQQWQLGTTADPCVGGTAFAIPSTSGTVRYGDFVCTFPVAQDGGYSVKLTFTEPCQRAGDCSSLVTKPRQRIQNVYVQDVPAVWQYDIAVAGLPASSRTVIAYAVNGVVKIKVETVLRAGVLSAVSIGPVTAVSFVSNDSSGPGRLYLKAGTAPSDTKYNGMTYDAVLFVDSADNSIKILRLDGTVKPIASTMRNCVGKGTDWDCAGIGLLPTTAGVYATIQMMPGVFTAIPATPEMIALPTCPAAGACWLP